MSSARYPSCLSSQIQAGSLKGLAFGVGAVRSRYVMTVVAQLARFGAGELASGELRLDQRGILAEEQDPALQR